MKITREEVLKIAEISRLKLQDDEVDAVVKQMDAVLGYAQRVQDLATQAGKQDTYKNVNVMRDGASRPSDAEVVLACAPEREENFFVVPRILDSK